MRLHIFVVVVLLALGINVDSSVPFEKRLIKDFEPKEPYVAMRGANAEEEESDHQCGSDKDCVDQGRYSKCGCAGDDCDICIEPNESRSAPKDRDTADDTTTIVTVTAKVWYVSDFTGGDSFPQSVIDTFDGDDTPQKRAAAVVQSNLDYMNFALANSEVPMRYVVWGGVQDIGKTEAEMIPASCQDSYCFDNLLTTFGDSEDGRLRLYQTADVVILYTNGPMASTWGVCGQYVHAPDDTQASYRAIIMAASYYNGWLFSHEAGHCVGASHLRYEGYDGDRTNFAFCPPGADFGTIDAYMWNCDGDRGKVPYFSNQDVEVDGVATGDAQNDNAKFMMEERFNSRNAGTNCLDGNPDDAWMNFEDGGQIGDNCADGETSYEVPLSSSVVDCEYSEWGDWGECTKPCSGGTQERTRTATREGWYGCVACTAENEKDSQDCNTDECPTCAAPAQIGTGSFTCSDSGSWVECSRTFDGDNETNWYSNKNSYGSNGEQQIDDLYQWAWGTYVEIDLGKEAIITQVQITNNVDAEDDDSNYKTVKLGFSNGYEEEVTLSNGKENDKYELAYPVQTTLLRVTGVSTWGVTNDIDWLPQDKYTGWRSGMSEIRMFGCEDAVDGGWTEWTDWTDCDESCGGGEQARTRTCTNPEPAGTGAPCDGEATETQACNTDECTCEDVAAKQYYCDNKENYGGCSGSYASWFATNCPKTCGQC